MAAPVKDRERRHEIVCLYLEYLLSGSRSPLADTSRTMGLTKTWILRVLREAGFRDRHKPESPQVAQLRREWMRRVYRRCVEIGITQYDLADLLQVSQGWVSCLAGQRTRKEMIREADLRRAWLLRVARRCREIGLTQRDLAAALGISPATLSERLHPYRGRPARAIRNSSGTGFGSRTPGRPKT